jgi:hypothetical protein
MDLVDEQRLAGLEIGEDRCEIARALDDRSRRRANGDTELVCDHVCQRCLAEAGRTVEQDVIERLAALTGRSNGDVKILAETILADVVVERPRAQPRFVLDVVLDAGPLRSGGRAPGAPGAITPSSTRAARP